MSEENKELFRQIMRIFETGDVSRAEAVLAPDGIDHSLMPGLPPGLEGFKQTVNIIHRAFPDMRLNVEILLAEGDKVAALVSSTGTHRGEFLGIPPTGKTINGREMHFARFENGKAVEHWGLVDVPAMMEQIGMPGGASR